MGLSLAAPTSFNAGALIRTVRLQRKQYFVGFSKTNIADDMVWRAKDTAVLLVPEDCIGCTVAAWAGSGVSYSPRALVTTSFAIFVYGDCCADGNRCAGF